MEVFVFDWWWTSHQSSVHKSLRIFRFCIVSGWDTREPSRQHSMGRKIGVVQKFTGIQKLGQNWWWANLGSSGIFPRIHYIAAQSQSSRVTVEIGSNTRELYRTSYLHVDVQRHLMGNERQQERMRGKCSTRLSLCKEIRSRTKVIPWTWIWKEMVLCQWR